MSEIQVSPMDTLSKDVRDLRDAMIELKATLTALDLPGRVKEIDTKVDDVDKRVTIMETRFGPIVAVASALLAGVVSWVVNIFSSH